jgi:hypothetical protein
MTIGSTFTQKLIRVTFVLKGGYTFDGTNNTLVLPSLRVHCSVEKQGEPTKNKCKLKIYGMSQSDMNKLTSIPGQATHALQVYPSLVKVEAGDAGGMSVVYQGDVTEAFSSYQQPPNLHFAVESLTAYLAAVNPVVPTSVKGGADVATVMSGLAAQMGYTFEDNGVNKQLNNPYLDGPAMSQAQALADAANIEFGVDDGTLFIAPTGQPRAGFNAAIPSGQGPLISAQTGLHEYPIFDKKGIKFKCYYTPGLKLGGLCVVQSLIPVCCGTWRINGLKHELTSLEPSAKWESHVTASWIGN